MIGRKAKIPKKLYKTDFLKLAKHEKSPEMRVRLLALENVKKGKSFRESSASLGLHEKTIRNLVRRFWSEGIDGLRNKPGRGRKPMLSNDRKEDFKNCVISAQKKLKGGSINGKDINKILATKFNVKCAISTTYDTLKRCDLSWVSSRSKHPKSDINKQVSFKKTLKVKLKKFCQNL
jgi:transposase